MIINALKKAKYLNYLKSRAWIDYLISYNLINVYQIWNSVFKKIIQTRDVIFNEKIIFNEDVETVKLKLKKT